MSRITSRIAVLAVFVVLAAGCSGDGESVPTFDANAATTTTQGAVASSSTTSSSTTIALETIEDFLDGYVGSYRTGNPVFLIQRIHPDLREYYGHETCRASYEGFVPDDTSNVTIRSISGPARWSESFDGVRFTFENVYTVDIEVVDFNRTRRQDLRLVQIDDRFYLFEDCGDPLVTTTSTIAMSQLDPDNDGFYYVHRGPGDSEDFVVPSIFRITYTGSDSTCEFPLRDTSTGTEVAYVTGLEGGGIRRLVLPDPTTTMYMSDLLGCDGGVLQVGPNP